MNYEGHARNKSIYFLAVNPSDNKQIISTGSDKTIRIWDFERGNILKKIVL